MYKQFSWSLQGSKWATVMRLVSISIIILRIFCLKYHIFHMSVLWLMRHNVYAVKREL